MIDLTNTPQIQETQAGNMLTPVIKDISNQQNNTYNTTCRAPESKNYKKEEIGSSQEESNTKNTKAPTHQETKSQPPTTAPMADNTPIEDTDY